MKALIEMPKDTIVKLEYDQQSGRMVVDRFLSIPVPSNYGFIEETFADDGDALDVFVLGPKLESLTEVRLDPIGVFSCIDNGEQDDKIVAVPMGLKLHNKEIMAEIRKIEDYLRNYKDGFVITDYDDSAIEAERVFDEKYDPRFNTGSAYKDFLEDE